MTAITGQGWELLVTRIGIHRKGDKTRTYSTYQAYTNGEPIEGLDGYMCECIGLGDNVQAGCGRRIAQGRYPLWTQFGQYRSIGYANDIHTAGSSPMPGLRLKGTGNRTGILIHPGHPPDLYLSSTGCFNPTNALSADQTMDFWDSRTRVIGLIDNLRSFSPSAFQNDTAAQIAHAWVVVDGESMALVPNFVQIASRER